MVVLPEDPAKIDETPLSKLLWQRKGKDLKIQVGPLHTLAPAAAKLAWLHSEVPPLSQRCVRSPP